MGGVPFAEGGFATAFNNIVIQQQNTGFINVRAASKRHNGLHVW